MLKYIVKRILQAVPLLILVTMICFTLINLAPYDAVDALRTDSMTEEELEAKREEYGLKKAKEKTRICNTAYSITYHVLWRNII